MENRCRQIYIVVALLIINSAVSASEQPVANDDSLTGLEVFGETYGPSGSHCSLGFIGFGSPVIVTRVSTWVKENWVVEADHLLTANGQSIRDESDLRDALESVSANGQIELTVLRAGERINISAECHEATPILEAREEALQGASEGRWDVCIRATYMEELHWGGANSQSAGIRLWCHQARILRSHSEPGFSASTISRLHVKLILEYASLLHDELQYVPGDLGNLRKALNLTLQQYAHNRESRQPNGLQSGLVSTNH
jgi:hypothetical protein